MPREAIFERPVRVLVPASQSLKWLAAWREAASMVRDRAAFNSLVDVIVYPDDATPEQIADLMRAMKGK